MKHYAQWQLCESCGFSTLHVSKATRVVTCGIELFFRCCLSVNLPWMFFYYYYYFFCARGFICLRSSHPNTWQEGRWLTSHDQRPRVSLCIESCFWNHCSDPLRCCIRPQNKITFFKLFEHGMQDAYEEPLCQNLPWLTCAHLLTRFILSELCKSVFAFILKASKLAWNPAFFISGSETQTFLLPSTLTTNYAHWRSKSNFSLLLILKLATCTSLCYFYVFSL